MDRDLELSKLSVVVIASCPLIPRGAAFRTPKTKNGEQRATNESDRQQALLSQSARSKLN